MMRAMLTRRRFLQGVAATVLLPPGAAEAAGLPKTQLSALRAAVRGPVIARGDKGYDAARVVFNRRWDGLKPPAVVRARDAADVRAAVRWADRFGVPLVARSGGHGYNGDSTSRSAVVIDLGALHHISLHSDGIVAIGPGARLATIYETLAAHGVTIPGGSCATVGLGGLVLGGGVGLAGRAMGLTLDRVRSFDAVTADGVLRRVDPTHHDDLFWALRGGGGSLALVTTVRLRVRHVSRAAFFRVSYPRAAREEALAAWDALAPHAPAALTAIHTLTSTGSSSFGQYLGSESALRGLVAPLAAIPGASLTTGSDTYLNVQRRWAGDPHPPRQAFTASSLYVFQRLGPSARRAFLAAADAGASLILDPYGGAINDVAPTATAFAHRHARFSVQVFVSGVAQSRVDRARRLIAPFGHGAYPNYADPGLANALTAYYGGNLARLRRVKAKYDPADRFRPAQRIR
jgi:FAD/FMN-containing dehydrogenase